MPIGMYQIALYVNGDSVAYFDSFGVEHIPEEIKRFIGNNNEPFSQKHDIYGAKFEKN